MNAFSLSSIVLVVLSCAVSPSAAAEVASGDAALPTYGMQAMAPTVAAILGVPAPKQAEAPAIDSIVKNLRGSQRVAILGMDAFGAAIWNKMRDKTPYLNSLALSNNQAQLRSVLPSVTCVNVGCMITGGSQKTTGITTFDSKIACEDLGSVLRANGMKRGGFGRKDYTGSRLLGRYADFSVADHGQHEITRANGTTGGAHGSASDVDCLVSLVWLPSVDRALSVPLSVSADGKARMLNEIEVR